MENIKKLPDSIEAMERRRRRAAMQGAQQKSNSTTDGMCAWDAIKKSRDEEKKNPEPNDRETIAKNLWHELDDYKGKLADLYIAAGLPHNIKDKVTLPPGKTGNDKELKVEIAPSLKLIESLSQATGEDLYLLADRILMGTTFHPVSFAKLQEAKLIFAALKAAVGRIDQEFKLWDQCMAIAEIRKPREKPYVDAVRRGDEEAAQAEFQWDIFDEDAPHKASATVEKWWPLEQLSLLNNIESEEKNIQVAIEPENAFWSRPYRYHESGAAGVWSGESVFFFPHIYLGSAIEWNRTKPDRPMEDQRWVDMSVDPEPFVRFDNEEYHVYLRDPKTGQEAYGGSEFNWDMSFEMSQAARWLIIYPDPEAKRLVPAIFSRGDFMQTELLPLCPRLIAEFDNPENWQYVGRDGAPTLLQRLKDLTGYVTGDFKVMDAWRETAARFHLNPIFRSSHPSETEKILYRRHLENWIAENQRSLDSYIENE